MVLSEEGTSRALRAPGQLPLGLTETQKINDEDGLGGLAPSGQRLMWLYPK